MYSQEIFGRKLMSFTLVAIMTLSWFLLPALTSNAQEGSQDGPPVGSQVGPPVGSQVGSSGGCENLDTGTSETGISNPLKSPSITCFLIAILEIILTLAMPIVILYIMYGGYLLVAANGEPEKIKTGRRAILWAVIGGVVILSSLLIMQVIENTVSSL